MSDPITVIGIWFEVVLANLGLSSGLVNLILAVLGVLIVISFVLIILPLMLIPWQKKSKGKLG